MFSLTDHSSRSKSLIIQANFYCDLTCSFLFTFFCFVLILRRNLLSPKISNQRISSFNQVLSIIQTWAETFRGQPDLNGVVQVRKREIENLNHFKN